MRLDVLGSLARAGRSLHVSKKLKIGVRERRRLSFDVTDG